MTRVESALCVWLCVVGMCAVVEGRYFVNETYPVVKNSRPVPRVSNLTLEEFYTTYTRGLQHPVVLTGLTDDWLARKKWTLDFFKKELGDVSVEVSDHAERVLQGWTIGRYIEYLETTNDERPHYMSNWEFGDTHKELLEDFTVPHLFRFNWAQYHEKVKEEMRWIFVGARGSYSQMHTDMMDTSAWLAQLQGRKRWVLYPPFMSPFLSKQESEEAVDAFAPDFERFPHYGRCLNYGALETVLEPGDVIFVPSKWWHQVINLDTSIALTINYIDASNIDNVMTLLDEQAEVRAAKGREPSEFHNWLRTKVQKGKFARQIAQRSRWMHAKEEL